MVKEYYKELVNIINKIVVYDKIGKKMDVYRGIQAARHMIAMQSSKGRSVFFIGNGGSAAIASHMAVDFWKNGGIRSFAFNDSSLLTCLGNDFGYEYVFEKPICAFAKENDVLIAISSSGKSKNILNAVKAAMEKRCRIITLSGFKKNNPLLRLGELNFYVPAERYSHVEIVHHSICHYLLDALMKGR